MVRSATTTVPDYLDSLPEDRRAVVAALRQAILRHLPKGYQETMNWGMICYEIPLARYPETYNGQPLGYIALAAQKNHFGLYLMGLFDEQEVAWLKDEFKKAGKKLDMGKCCVRFRKLEDLPEGLAGRAAARLSVKELIARYEAVRQK